MLAGAQEVARENGRLVILVDTDGHPEIESDAISTLVNHRVDGMVYASMYHRVIPAPAGLPAGTVFLDCRPEDGGYPAVVPDDYSGGRVATQELVDAGHRRIAYIDNDEDRPVAAELRLRGYLDVLAESGIDPDPALHVFSPTSAAGGQQAAAELFALEPAQRPTGVFAYNDRIAAGVVTWAHRHGIRIPEDLSIVGYDDQQLVASELDPPLTTVSLPTRPWAAGRWRSPSASAKRTPNPPTSWTARSSVGLPSALPRTSAARGTPGSRTDATPASPHDDDSDVVVHRKEPMKKSFIPLAAMGVAAALVMTGCGQAGQGSATTEDGRTVLTMWTHSAGNPAELAVYEKIISDFNASQEKYEVKTSRSRRAHTTTRSSRRLPRATFPACSTSTAPSCRTGRGRTTCSPEHLERHHRQAAPTAVGKYNDEIYSAGYWDAALGIFARKSVLDANGIRIPSIEQPWTEAEFDAALATLKAAGYETPIDLGAEDKGEWWPYAYPPSCRASAET